MGDDSTLPGSVEALIERARDLTDEERRILAEARADMNETFRVGAWRAAVDAMRGRADLYVDAWARIGSAHVPDRLEELVNLGPRVDAGEVATWQDVARLGRLAIDEALLALLTADTIPPPNLRELLAPWKAMLSAAAARP